MSYKKESISKLFSLARACKEKYMNCKASEIKICISNGNRKIGRVMNVSLMPIMTCHNCQECKYYCYDVKACLQYPNTVIDARIRNTVLLQLDREEYFNRIQIAISRRRLHKYFRWHVAGDIPDFDYFVHMVEIAREFPDFVFWTYTKHYSVINSYCDTYSKENIPENLHVMFSEWDGMPLVNPYNFPVFTCKMKDGNRNHKPEYFDALYKCPGNCDLCKEYKLGCIGGMSTYCDEH